MTAFRAGMQQGAPNTQLQGQYLLEIFLIYAPVVKTLCVPELFVHFVDLGYNICSLNVWYQGS